MVEKLCKRPRENAEDDAIEKQAHKKLREREAAERTLNLEWARRVAPCASQILFRHFQHVQGDPHPQTSDLSFGTIVLSLLHSGPEYLDDLSERLSDTMPSGEVESHVKRLYSIAEGLSSPEIVGQECMDEFMRLLNLHLDRRLVSDHMPILGRAAPASTPS